MFLTQKKKRLNSAELVYVFMKKIIIFSLVLFMFGVLSACNNFEMIDECGDFICGTSEAYEDCPTDCEEEQYGCGDGECGADETVETCPQDCQAPPQSYCGDGTCDADETSDNCLDDCPGSSPPPPQEYCGDNICNNGETQESCPSDCQAPPQSYCGDGTCNGPDETDTSCPEDCEAVNPPNNNTGDADFSVSIGSYPATVTEAFVDSYESSSDSIFVPVNIDYSGQGIKNPRVCLLVDNKWADNMNNVNLDDLSTDVVNGCVHRNWDESCCYNDRWGQDTWDVPGSETLYFRPACGENNFAVFVDATGGFDETNEQNNIVRGNVYAECKPDVNVEIVAKSPNSRSLTSDCVNNDCSWPSEAIDGEEVVFYIGSRSSTKGNLDVVGYTVSMYSDDELFETWSLGKSITQFRSVKWVADCPVGKTVTIRAAADYVDFDRSRESNPDNNEIIHELDCQSD